jgi:hypothetical protein
VLQHTYEDSWLSQNGLSPDKLRLAFRVRRLKLLVLMTERCCSKNRGVDLS